jgi:Tfp pilus assembly protein PilZ
LAGTRKHRRIIKRIETEFSSGGLYFRGISSDMSEKGLFVRTSRPFAPNTALDLTLHLPDNVVSRLKGVVRWAAKVGIVSGKDGMGVEIIQSDRNFADFLNSFLPASEKMQHKAHKAVKPVSAPAESKPATPPKSEPTRPEKKQDSEGDEIDSMISSLFPKKDKK